jgi:hypothetical protein
MIRASSLAPLVTAAALLAGCGEQRLAPVWDGEPAPAGNPGMPPLNTTPWFSDDTLVQYDRRDWMGELPDNLLLSDLSIPGTHETMSRDPGFWSVAQCQMLTLVRQLNAGIRAFDIRLRHARDSLFAYHGPIDQHATFGRDVLEVFRGFLAAHPTEAIVMRVQEDPEFNDQNRRTFAGTFEWYRDSLGYASSFWLGNPAGHFGRAPRLGDVREKIVVLQDFEGHDSQDHLFGLPWYTVVLQDKYTMYPTHESFTKQWSYIRNHVDAAMTQDSLAWYVNSTSGASGAPLLIPPVAFARGMWIPFHYEDGMNQRTYRYLTSCYGNQCPPFRLDEGAHGRVGTILSDFPGPGLIDAVIAENGLPRLLANDPPVAIAGGPYVANEGTAIVFDASASSDHEEDPLQYRWDVDGDSVFDTPWSSAPTATHTWFDDYQGIAQVEVSDGDPSHADQDVAAVTVLNVPPAVVIDSVASVVLGYLLPGQTAELHGSFVDPGYPDTHTASWRFGDQATLTGTLVERNEPPEARGTVADGHVYGAPGFYEVELDVLDDDGGLGTNTTQLHVLSAAEALQFIDGHIRALPDSVFRKPADNRKDALSNKLAAVQAMLTKGDLSGALNKLRHDIRAKLDGFVDGKAQDDWIIDPASRQLLCLMLDELMRYMEGPM